MLPLEIRCFRCPIDDIVYDAPMTLRMLPSENRCTPNVIDFVHDFNNGYRWITDPKNVAFGCYLWKFVKFRCPIDDSMYIAPMTLRMLPSEIRCNRKVIGFVHDFNDGYQCITDPKNVAFGCLLSKFVTFGALSMIPCTLHQ